MRRFSYDSGFVSRAEGNSRKFKSYSFTENAGTIVNDENCGLKKNRLYSIQKNLSGFYQMSNLSLTDWRIIEKN